MMMSVLLGAELEAVAALEAAGAAGPQHASGVSPLHVLVTAAAAKAQGSISETLYWAGEGSYHRKSW